MASRSRLYTRFRSPRLQLNEITIKKINLVIFDIDFDNFSIVNPLYGIKIFANGEIDACIDYVKSGIDDIYLFTSNVINSVFIQLIDGYPQIKSCYIFSKDQQYEKPVYVGSKLRGVFRNFQTMFEQFQNDYFEIKNQYYSEESTFENINEESGRFLWWRFFDKMLLYMQHTDIAKDEFIEFSTEVFKDDPSTFKQIEDIKNNYRSDQAIFWYTKDTFLFSFMNRILRRQRNVNNIFKLRVILTDLVSALKTAQLESYDENIRLPLTLYRGQAMQLKDIEYLQSHIGDTMTFNQFLSTSMDQEVARFYAEPYDTSFTKSALFAIEIDSISTDDRRTPFADVSKHSAYMYESEFLFSMHSTFRVESVEQHSENLYLIKLKYVDNIWETYFGERSIFSPHADQIFIRHLSKENIQFNAFQLLLDMILRLDQTEYAKQELLQYSRSKYQHDSTVLKQIDDFEQNYQSENAAKWYTKDSFLYRLLNETLRIEMIDSIVKMRYFIHDLHNQLAQLQPLFIQSLNSETNLTLYRGQLMNIDDLNKISDNRDGLISMNSFLSATKDIQVAIAFSGDGTTENPADVSVIYEMSIDTNIRSTPYAKIETFMKDEQEILFSMGAVFRIGEVDKLPDHEVYRIQLKMEHIEDELWNKLTAHLD